MKKLLLQLLFVLSFSTSLYPLTNQDWIVIRTFTVSGSTLGAIGGIVGGGTLGAAVGMYVAPMPNSHLVHNAAEGDVHKIKSLRSEKIIVSIILTGMVGGGAASFYFGNTLAKKLVTNYIARKYGVTAATAREAIQHNLDLAKD